MAASSTALRGLSSRACGAQAGCIRPVRAHSVCQIHSNSFRQQHVGLSHLQQRQSLHSRTAIIAAAGRRRRQATAAEPPADDEPDLDMDDVMFNPEGDDDEVPLEAEEGEAELDWEEEAEDVGDEEEFEEFEEAEEGEEEAWDAALAEFDTAQDVPLDQQQEPAGPTKEEQEKQKALDMVSFDPGESEAELVIEEPRPLIPYRPKTFEEQTALLSIEDKDTLTRNLQNYAVFPLEFVDLLVPELEDGRMILADCFILDRQEEVYMRPTVDDDVSRTPTHYQLIPWEHTKTGDFLKNIDPEVTLLKMYFVAVADPSDVSYQIDFSEIYSFDGKHDRMSKHEIKRLGEEPIKEPVMRIREDGIFVEDAYRVPGVAAVAEGFAGHPEDVYLNPDKEFDIREFVKMGLWPQPGEYGTGDPDNDLSARPSRYLDGPGAYVGNGDDVDQTPAQLGRRIGVEEDTSQGIEERLEELELMEEMDDAPDVPAVDMM